MVEDILFSENPLEFVGLTLYPWKFHTKQSFTPGNSTKSCYTTWLGLFQKKSKQGFQTKQSSTLGYSTKLCKIPWKFQGQKQRLPEIPHYSFLVTLGNSPLFIINPRKFHMLFLWYPWKLHILNILNPPPLPLSIFSGIAPWKSQGQEPRPFGNSTWVFSWSSLEISLPF